jgi:hypothetical protein
MKILRFLFAMGFLGVLSAQAQPLRFELGQRTRAMELAWEAQPNAAARKRATAHLKQAVTLFFAFKLNEAAKQLDYARFALQSAPPLSQAAQWAESLYVWPETRLLDSRASTLVVTLDKLYPTTEDIPQGALLKLRFSSSHKAKTMDFPIAGLPVKQQAPLALAKVAEGDFTLVAKVVVGGGGAVRNVTEALQKLPFFIGIGTEDFALRGAKALHDALQKAEVKTIRYREYADIEHLTIVQVALQEVFAFFDGFAKKK